MPDEDQGLTDHTTTLALRRHLQSGLDSQFSPSLQRFATTLWLTHHRQGGVLLRDRTRSAWGTNCEQERSSYPHLRDSAQAHPKPRSSAAET
jgi:hypothetical protein